MRQVLIAFRLGDKRKEKIIAIVPGEVFGPKKHFRIYCGLPVPKLKEAPRLTDDFLKKQLMAKASAR